MNDTESWLIRTMLLSQLVVKSPAKLGRTALMKLAYLLQTVRDVPLGYDFRLYTYGPFDSNLLNDLAMAESFGLVESEMIPFVSGSGYGYEFAPGPKYRGASEKFAGELAAHQSAIEWALANFADCTASDLELLTTVIYADREVAQRKDRVSRQELVKMVCGVKPHFSEPYVSEKVEELSGQGLLLALFPRDQGPHGHARS